MHKRTPRKRQTLSPAKLLAALLRAARRNDRLALARLCEQYSDEIVQSFPSWCSPSEQHRKDKASSERYDNGLLAIASYFEGAGDSSLIQVLKGGDAAKTGVQWKDDVVKAKFLIDAGRVDEAVQLLHAILTRTQHLDGLEAMESRFALFGFLATAYAQVRNYPMAIEFGQQALELSSWLHDNEKAKASLKLIKKWRRSA